MLTAENIRRALIAVLEVSRGHTMLLSYRTACATRLSQLLDRRVLLGTLNAYAESIQVTDSFGQSFALSFDADTPLGEVMLIDPEEQPEIASNGTVAASAVLGERVGAFFGVDTGAQETVDGRALIDLSYQTTLAMETILERAEAYRETEVMAREAQTKSELLATIAHEIKTPLNVIINIPERIRRELGKTPASETDVTSRTLDMLERSGQHLMTLLNDVVDLDRVETGKPPMRPVEVDSRSVLEHAAASSLDFAEHHEVTVSLHLEEELGVVIGDPVRMTQIFLNMLSNAIKYSGRPGRVEVTAAASDDWVRVCIRDNGLGIGLQDQSRIFERYVRLHDDDDETDETGGSGLGLYITKRLVEAHHGRIWVESELGHGSSFFVELPRRADVESSQNSTSQAEFELEPQTIILVDDDETILEMATLLLEELGHTLVSTTDVSEVEAIVASCDPSLLVLDVGLNGANGLEVLDRLRRRHDPSELPVLVSSGHAIDPRDLEHLGAGWLPKPWKRLELIDAIQRQLRAED